MEFAYCLFCLGLDLFYFDVHECFVCVSMWVPCEYPWRSEDGIDPLELELGMAVTLHVGAENQTQVLYKDNKGSQLRSHLSSPLYCLLYNSFNVDGNFSARAINIPPDNTGISL